MSKRKFKKGAQVKSLDELFQHEYFIVNGKTTHCGWCRAWQLGTARRYIERGCIHVAVKLTNGEYYSGKSDDDIKDMLENGLCEGYCPLPDPGEGQAGAMGMGRGWPECMNIKPTKPSPSRINRGNVRSWLRPSLRTTPPICARCATIRITRRGPASATSVVSDSL